MELSSIDTTLTLDDALFAARPYRHLMLIGPSGAGKSTVAPRVAQKLGWTWMDLDDEVMRRAGCTVADIFTQRGETAFRTLEQAALKTLLQRRRPTVIAAGGGAWHNPWVRAMAQGVAQEVQLHVSPNVAASRLESDPHSAVRPRLMGSDLIAAMQKLALDRHNSYALCTLTVPADLGGPEDVAKRVVQAVRRHIPKVLNARHEGGHYSIKACNHGPHALTELIARHPKMMRVAVITDNTVLGLFGAAYVDALNKAGRVVSMHAVTPGEGSKTFATAERLMARLQEAGLKRGDVIVGLGGGMVLDLSAFVAGIYLRGVAFVGVATTALAAVDASAGGKCGINMGAHKNQVGLIRAPRGVLVDMAAVMAQPPQERRAGAVEALKMGALFSSELFDSVLKAGEDKAAWQRMIMQAVALKVEVCRQDPLESGLRATLNYGHTIGHAIESGSGFTLSHGEAIALGMVAEAAYAEQQGWAHRLVQPLVEALRAMNMPVDWRRATVQSDALQYDKKSDGRTLMLPVVTSLGHVKLHSVPLAHLMDFVRRS